MGNIKAHGEMRCRGKKQTIQLSSSSLALHCIVTGLKWDFQIKQIVLWETPSVYNAIIHARQIVHPVQWAYRHRSIATLEVNGHLSNATHGRSCKNNAGEWLRCRQLVVWVSSLPKTEVTETNKYSRPLPPSIIWHLNSVTQPSAVGVHVTIFDGCTTVYDLVLCGQNRGQP